MAIGWGISDRLFNHTARAFVEFAAPDALRLSIVKFTEMLYEFFSRGGVDLSPLTSENDTRHFSDLGDPDD
jgi:hypothetical protein